MVDVRRIERDPGLAHLLAIGGELLLVVAFHGHRRGEELDRVVRLEPGGLIGEQRVGGGVALVEAVGGELGHRVEDRVGELGDRCPRATAPVDEGLALGVHLGLDLLAHGAAQKIGTAQRVAGELLGDLHHLFLVDDDAVGLLQDRLEQRVQIARVLEPVLDVDVARDVVHRPRPIERVHGDDVLEAVGLQLAQGIAHAGRFQLEHALRLGPRQKLEGRRIVERQCCQLQMRAALDSPAARHARAWSGSTARGSRT